MYLFGIWYARCQVAGIPYDLATISTSDQAVFYRLTADDVLWTARAAGRESGADEAALVAWTLTQRFVLYYKAQGRSYVDTLRSFAQPVNPVWARSGEKCRPGGPFYGKPECSEEKLKLRAWYTNATWEQLSERHPETVQVITAWAQGLVPNQIPGVTNYAIPRVAKNYVANTKGASIAYKGHNFYVIDPGARNWPADYVQMVAANGEIAFYNPSITQKTGAMFAALVNGAANWWRGA